MVKHIQCLDVTRVDNHELSQLPLVDAGAKATTQLGDIILIMHEHAHHGLDRTIHASIQIKAHKNKVDDRSLKAGGTQCI